MLKRLAPRSALAIVVLLVCSALRANAQSTTGSISGVIKDQVGGVLPGADIVVVHTASGLERHQVSDATGFYRVLNLTPGEYVLTARLSGFRWRRIEPLTVSMSRDLRVDVELDLGLIDKVEVLADSRRELEIGSTAVGGVVTTRQIAELPL